MNTATKHDLEDMTTILEALVKRLPKLTFKERVDVGARIRAVTKHAATIDEMVKDEIKKKATGKAKVGSPYHANGEIFKACVNIVPTTRLDQKELATKYPDEHAECSHTNNESRVTYEPR